MAKNHSDHYKERTGATSGEAPVYLLEVTHSQLLVPIRVCTDTQDLVSNGNTFTSCEFRINWPEDAQGLMPRVPVSIDNIGRELTQWLELSNGGKGAEFRCMEVMRDTPDVIEQEYTMTLLRSGQNMLEVTGDLGYENVLDLPGLAATYTPETAPGLF